MAIQKVELIFYMCTITYLYLRLDQRLPYSLARNSSTPDSVLARPPDWTLFYRNKQVYEHFANEDMCL